MNLKEQLAALQKSMQAIVTKSKAEGRDLTEAEITEIEAGAEKAADLKSQIERVEKSGDLMKQFASTGEQKSSGAYSQWSIDAMSQLQKRAGESEIGFKALIGTTVDVPAVVSPLVELPQLPTTVLDLIPRVPLGAGDQLSGANTFTYTRQTATTNNAAAVADGGQKPQSDFTFDEVEDRVRVYAHTTGDIPERFFDDYAKLIGIVGTGLGYGIEQKLQNDIISSDGTGEGFKGILATSGVQVQAAVGTDVLATLSAAYLKLLLLGETPNAWVMNPTDYAALTLMRENGTTGALLFGSGRTTLSQIIGDAPIIPSTSVAAKTVLVGDYRQTALVVRQNTALKTYQDATMVEHNVVRIRAEGRFGFQVLRPRAFVKVTLP
ncbi:phage major capsid protein [Leifsonia aquatica]|uniref:phage major capsid protein n=1 Tax=Leifsonia aquatica TaxID=144185 RepID=UPI00380C3C38